MRYDLPNIYDALVEISLDKSNDSETVCKSKSLANKISTFNFVCSAVLWHEILRKINIASKLLQSPNMIIPECIKVLESVILFLKDFCANGFQQILTSAKEMEINSDFELSSSLRIRRKCKLLFTKEQTLPSLIHQGNLKLRYLIIL